MAPGDHPPCAMPNTPNVALSHVLADNCAMQLVRATQASSM